MAGTPIKLKSGYIVAWQVFQSWARKSLIEKTEKHGQLCTAHQGMRSTQLCQLYMFSLLGLGQKPNLIDKSNEIGTIVYCASGDAQYTIVPRLIMLSIRLCNLRFTFH